MKARVKWAGDLTFVGHSDSDHAVVMDAGKKAGGLGIGASPMEMLLMGAGGCASIDMVMILKKARQDISDVTVEIEADRADEHPRVLTRMHMHFRVSGSGLSEKQVARAVELSMTKYCSASGTLAKACPLTYDFEIVEEAEVPARQQA